MAAASSFVYADATALIGLARIERLDLLALLRAPVLVTTCVWEEVAGDQGKRGVAALWKAREEGLLAVIDEGDASARAAVLIDERRARACINEHPELRTAIAHITGIIGLVLLARERGWIAAVKPLLERLRRQQFRISTTLYREALRRAGES